MYMCYSFKCIECSYGEKKIVIVQLPPSRALMSWLRVKEYISSA